METINLTEVFQAIIYVLLVLVSLFVIPYIKAKVGNENMTDFLRWVDIGVAAAEQLYNSFEGEKKKQYVIDLLEEKGFSVDENSLDASIEAAVRRLHNELYGSVKVGEKE